MPTATLPVRPSANDEAPQGAGENFEIVATQVILEDLRANQPFAKVAFGEVARCPNRGGFIARSAAPGIAGPGCFRYWIWAPVAQKVGECLKGPENLLDRIDRVYEELAYIPGFNDLAPTPFEADRAKFEAMFPALMPHFGLAQVKLQRLFDPGKCQHPKFVKGLADLAWGPYLERHLSGDFGSYGTHDPEALDCPERAWCVGLEEIAIQNGAVIRYGQGVIRSVYELEPTDHAKAKPGLSVCIVTSIGTRSRVGTLMCVRQNNMLL